MSFGQKQLLTKRWLKMNNTEEREKFLEKIENMTRGEAYNIIVRLKHGAQSRFEKKMKANSKAAAIASKEEAIRNRHVIKVGPLTQ